MHEVLVERPARRGGLMLGRTRTNLTVLLPLEPDSIGAMMQVQLTGTTGATFTGAVQRYLNWNESSRGAVILKKACGVLVITGGAYLILSSMR